MLERMVSHQLVSHRWADSAAVAIMTPVGTVAQAVACATAGARLVDVGSDDALIPAIRKAAGGLLICGDGAAADVVRDAGLAATTGAGLICPGPGPAADAVRRGIAPDRILVQCTPAGIERASASGWAALVDVDAVADSLVGLRAEADLSAGVQAVAAVCAWLGASVIRTRHVAGVRRSLDMTESILGIRPPAWAVRGLA